MAQRLIFHVDVNSAFLSWEATRRVQKGQPDLREVPACIGGDPAIRRGVVLAKSIPAKKFGVKIGEPLALALRKCPELVIAPPDFKLYTKCSRAFKDICRAYAPAVEEISIDECFMDLTGTEVMYPDPIALAHEIKDRIRRELGFTVNIGVARNKLCAKMASDFEKPDRVHTLFPEEIPEKMWPLPVGELLFVGGASVRRLNEARIFTIGDLAHADETQLRYLLGEKLSRQARRYANGVDDSPVRARPEQAKGYSNSVTLEEDVTDLPSAEAILLALSDSVSAHMRAEGARAGGVSVSIRYLDFRNRSHQCRLESPTDSTNEIYATARRLLSELWTDRRPLRLMGIALTNLAWGEEGEQLTLFGGENAGREKDAKMNRAVDALRSKYGSDIIQRGTVLSSGVRVARKFKGTQGTEREETDGAPGEGEKPLLD